MTNKKCASCNHPSEENAKFCSVCGLPVSKDEEAKKCTSCNEELKGAEKFCSHCGKEVVCDKKEESAEDKGEETSKTVEVKEEDAKESTPSSDAPSESEVVGQPENNEVDEVPEPEEKESDEEKLARIEEKMNKKFLKLAVVASLFFAVCAIIFSMQLTNQVQSMQKDLNKLEHNTSKAGIYELFFGDDEKKITEEDAKQPEVTTLPYHYDYSEVEKNPRPTFVYSEMQLEESNNHLTGYFNLYVSEDDTFSNKPIHLLNAQEASEYLYYALEGAVGTSMPIELLEGAETANVDVFINDIKVASYDGSKFHFVQG